MRLALHLGDIKSGSTTCTDARFAAALATFESFKDPVVYTPGDNEWTDCHRVNNGGEQGSVDANRLLFRRNDRRSGVRSMSRRAPQAGSR